MKKIISLLFAFILAFGMQAQNLSWARHMGGNMDDFSNAIALDASGNVYTAGTFQDTTDFDPGPGTFTLSSDGKLEIFLTKFDASGNFIWAKKMSGSFTLFVSLAVDLNNNIILAGTFINTAVFAPGFSLTSSGSDDAFIYKLDPFGNPIWVRRFGGSQDDAIVAITTDASGNVLATGGFQGQFDFNPGPVVETHSASIGDPFVIKFDSSGNYVWGAQFKGSSNNNTPFSIKADQNNNVYITGGINSQVDFDPGPAVYNAGSAQENAFTCKLSANGAFSWVTVFSGPSLSQGGGSLSSCLDAMGNVYSTGLFYNGSFSFDASHVLSGNPNSYNIFVCKLDTAGHVLWAESMGNTTVANYCVSKSIALDAANNIIVGGYFGAANFDFDPGAGTYNLTPFGPPSASAYSPGDGFIVKLDANGNLVWADQVGGAGDDYVTGIAVNAQGIYACGNFEQVADMDPGPAVQNFTSAGSADLFVLALDNTHTGIQQLTTSADLVSISPNPCAGALAISSSVDAELQITDLSGRLIKTIVLNAFSHHTATVCDLQEGAYLVCGTTPSGTIRKKIIVLAL